MQSDPHVTGTAHCWRNRGKSTRLLRPKSKGQNRTRIFLYQFLAHYNRAIPHLRFQTTTRLQSHENLDYVRKTSPVLQITKLWSIATKWKDRTTTHWLLSNMNKTKTWVLLVKLTYFSTLENMWILIGNITFTTTPKKTPREVVLLQTLRSARITQGRTSLHIILLPRMHTSVLFGTPK